MTEANQKILYKHFKKLSVDGINSIIRDRAKNNAKEILDSFPQFEKPITKEVKEKK